VLDVWFHDEEKRARNKLCFFFWCPERVGVKDKMVGASTYTSFNAKLNVAAKIQATDASDIELAAIVAKVK